MERRFMSGQDILCDVYIRNTRDTPREVRITPAIGVYVKYTSYLCEDLATKVVLMPYVSTTGTVQLARNETRKIMGVTVRSSTEKGGAAFLDHTDYPVPNNVALLPVWHAPMQALYKGIYKLCVRFAVNAMEPGAVSLSADSAAFRVVE